LDILGQASDLDSWSSGLCLREVLEGTIRQGI
jgi:hypothetical protein